MRKAAEQIHITQSTIWHNVRELEKQLGGVQLFTAHPKGVEPTPEANELYTRVHLAFGIIQSGESNVLLPHKDSRLTIRIGCPAMITNTVLLDYIIDFNRQYPSVKLEIHEKPQEELADMLTQCDIDILIYMGSFNNPGKSFSIIPIKTMQHTFFASSDFAATHHLSDKISKQHLLTLPVILFRKPFTKDLLEKLQIDIQPVFEAYTAATMYHLVYKSVGIGYTTKDFFLNSYANDKIIQLDFDGQLPTTELSAIANKNNESNIVRAFINGLKSLFK